MLFNWAYKGKLNKIQAGYNSAEAAPFWDKLVFGKARCPPLITCRPRPPRPCLAQSPNLTVRKTHTQTHTHTHTPSDLQIAAGLGGEVRAIVSGGAPLAPHVEEFLKVAMCAPVVQGYGLTETCAASFIALPDKISQAGTVGPPQPVTEFCLESVPEMKYDAQAEVPRGELLVRGPNTFLGYFKMQDKTVRSFLDSP